MTQWLSADARDLGRKSSALALAAVAIHTLRVQLVQATAVAPIAKVIGVQSVAALAAVTAVAMAAYFALQALREWLAHQVISEEELARIGNLVPATLSTRASKRVDQNANAQIAVTRILTFFDVFIPALLPIFALILLWSEVIQLPNKI